MSTKTKTDDLLEVGKQEVLDKRLTRMADAVEDIAPAYSEELRKRVGKAPAKNWTTTLRKAIPDEVEDERRREALERFADRFTTTEDDLAPNAHRKEPPTVEKLLYMDVLRAEGHRKNRNPMTSSPAIDLEGLDDLSVKELRALAQETVEIDLPSKARKADIITRIKDAAS